MLSVGVKKSRKIKEDEEIKEWGRPISFFHFHTVVLLLIVAHPGTVAEGWSWGGEEGCWSIICPVQRMGHNNRLFAEC